jgi:hypothetical protein
MSQPSTNQTGQNNTPDPLLISFLHLRRAIGVLGVALPILMVAGVAVLTDCKIIQPTISDYYFTKLGYVFVGTLCAVALFLYCYKGYDNDWIASKLACLFALGVAFFPTYGPKISAGCNFLNRNSTVTISRMHDIFATSLFLTLAYFCLFLFVQSGGKMTPQKRKRNRIYRFCGYAMILCIILSFVYLVVIPRSLQVSLSKYTPVFIFETLALWFFGFSWLTKGEFILKDQKDE